MNITINYEYGDIVITGSRVGQYTRKDMSKGFKGKDYFYYDPKVRWVEYTVQIKGKIFRWKQKEFGKDQLDVIMHTFYPGWGYALVRKYRKFNDKLAVMYQ